MSKFVKGEKVLFVPSTRCFNPAVANMQLAAIPTVITKVKGNTYQIKGFAGFWPEEFFQKMED